MIEPGGNRSIGSFSDCPTGIGERLLITYFDAMVKTGLWRKPKAEMQKAQVIHASVKAKKMKKKVYNKLKPQTQN